MDIRIDTLRLRASGMDRDAARQFARLVAERLGMALATWQSSPDAERLSGLRIAVQARAGDGPDSLAAHLAAEVSRALRSASTPAGPAFGERAAQGGRDTGVAPERGMT